MFGWIPLMLGPVVAYNVMAMTFDGGFGSYSAAARLARQTSAVPTASGALLSLSVSDMFLIGSLLVLFLELFRSATAARIPLVNHTLSMLLFMICVAQFLLLPAFATPTFFLITIMVLMDVLARAAQS